MATSQYRIAHTRNAVCRKVAGVASEEVTVELLKVKCLPVRS